MKGGDGSQIFPSSVLDFGFVVVVVGVVVLLLMMVML
jgi:hypothetical protein